MGRFKRKQKTPKFGEHGGTGTVFFQGTISEEEYNSTLEGKAGLAIYDKMRRSDSQVNATLFAVQTMIRQALWKVSPFSDSPKDVKISDFVSKALFDHMEMSWDDFLKQAILHLPFGFMVFEKVYEVVDGKIWFKKLAPRLPRTIDSWIKDENDNLLGVMQELRTESGTRTVRIPADKLIIFTNMQEGSNYEGISVLRSAYKNWFMKSNLELLDTIKHDRWAVGIPEIKLPEDCDPNSEDFKRAEDIAKNLRSHDQGFVLTPFGYEIKILEAPSQTGTDILSSIAYHDEGIAKNLLTQFITLGTSKSGARSLGEGFQEFFLLALRAIVNYIIDVMNKQCIKAIVDLNFDTENYPILTAGKIEVGNFSRVADALVKLTSGGVLTPDDSLEGHMRDIGNLPPLRENILSPSDRLNIAGRGVRSG